MILNLLIKFIQLFLMKKDAPARETVEVSMLPKNVNVEISLIAIV